MKCIFFSLFVYLIFGSCSLKQERLQIKPIESINVCSVDSHEKHRLWQDSILIENQWVKILRPPIDSITTESDFFNNEDLVLNRLDTILAKRYLLGYYDPLFVFVLCRQYSNENFFSLILYQYVDCESKYVLVTINRETYKLIDREIIMDYVGDCSEAVINYKRRTIFNKNHFKEHSVLEYWTSNDSTIYEVADMNIHKVETIEKTCEILENGLIECITKEEDEIVP